MFCIHAPVTQHHSLCIKRRLMQNGIKLSGFYHIIVRNLNIILLVRERETGHHGIRKIPGTNVLRHLG